MKNTIKSFVQSRGITAYALSKRTGIPLNTVYRLVNQPTVIPSGEVMNAILNEFSNASVSDLLIHSKDREVLNAQSSSDGRNTQAVLTGESSPVKLAPRAHS